jgi:hypothetical protein
MNQQTDDEFRAARLKRKRQSKWWRNHIPLAYATSIGILALLYFVSTFVFRNFPIVLRRLGVTPSGVNLLMGTVSLALGIWGLRRNRDFGMGWVFIYVLCVAGGILNMLKAFGFL